MCTALGREILIIILHEKVARKSCKYDSTLDLFFKKKVHVGQEFLFLGILYDN